MTNPVRTVQTSPEYSALVAAIQHRFSPEQAIPSRLPSLDADLFARLAQRHRVEALLVGAPASFVPTSRASDFEARADANRARGAQLLDELTALMTSFSRAGVDTLTFKGPILSLDAYGDLGARFCWDLDLLFKKHDIPGVAELFAERGYHQVLELRSHEVSSFFHYHFALLFRTEATDLEIDAHWSLVPVNLPFRVDLEGMRQRAVTRDINGVPVQTTNAEDTLLLLSVHGAKEEWKRLSMICDVAAFLHSHPDLDWSVCLQRATRAGARRALLLAASLASRFGVSLPGEVSAAVAADVVITDLTRQLDKNHADPDYQPQTIFKVSRFRRQVLDRKIDCLRYVLTTVTMPRIEHLRLIRLPGFFKVGYIPVRLVHDYIALPLFLAYRSIRQVLR